MPSPSSIATDLKPYSLTNALYPWVVCLSAGLFFFYEFIQLHMFNSLSADLMRDFSISAWGLGLLSNTYLMADILFLLPAGIILDRYSVRHVILFAICLCVLGTFGFSSTHSIVLAGIFHFLSGIGNAFCFLSCILLTSRWFEPRRQALVVGIIVTMAMTGGWIAQTPLALLTQAVGWRNTLLLVALLGVSIMALIYAVVEDYPRNEKHESQKSVQADLGFWFSIAIALQNSQNWLCGIYTSLFNLPIMILGAAMGDLYLTQAHHLTLAEASTASGMLFVGTIIGAPLSGWISDTLERRKLPMMIGGILSLATILYMILGPELTAYRALLSFFLLGLFTSTQVISYPMISESNREDIRGTALAIASVLIMGGAFIMTQLYVWLLQQGWQHLYVNNVALYSPVEFFHAMLLMPVAFLVGLAACSWTRETYCRKTEI